MHEPMSNVTATVQSERPNQPLFKMSIVAVVLLLLLQSACVDPRPSPPPGGLPGPVQAFAFPSWLTAEFAMVFAEFDSFSARMEVEVFTDSGAGISRPITGDLLGNYGHLLFIPKMNRRAPFPGGAPGGVWFLWHSQSNAAFVLSEPMQAYAPAPSELSSSIVTVVSTDDLTRFPLQIRCPKDSSTVKLVFSKISFKPQPIERFAVPDGFTRYSSVESMASELMARQRVMMPGRLRGPPGGMSGGPGGGPPR